MTYIYDIHKQAKLVFGDTSWNSGYLWRGWLTQWEDENILYLDLDGGYTV